MIALYLLAAHMVGDFVLQTRFQAAEKLSRPAYRARHVLAYCIPFVPIAILYSRWADGWVSFLYLLAILHYWTDSSRLHSTLGDIFVWLIARKKCRFLIWEARVADEESSVSEMPETMMWPPPNEWGPMPLLIDQTLHLCQLAVLGGIFLS